MTTSNDPGGTTVSTPSELEIVISRIFDAPRELVFEASTRAEHFVRWWGPHEYQITTCELDARLGGTWRVVQLGPDGTEYVFGGVFRDVVPPERVVMTQIFEPHPDDEVLVTTTFEEVGQGRTRLTSTSQFPSAASRDGMIAAGMERGARETYDRLAEHLEVMHRGTIVERVFEAPRELVWDAWTDPKHVAQWWGPNGFTNTIQEMDVRPGGVWRFIMHGPDGTDYPNRIRFVEVVRPERLVYDHGGEDQYADFRSVVTFDDERGKTRVTMRTLFSTPAVREYAVREYHAIEGASQTLDRLGAYLANLA